MITKDFIKGIRFITGYGMMDIKKALELCGEDLSRENFKKQMVFVQRGRI